MSETRRREAEDEGYAELFTLLFSSMGRLRRQVGRLAGRSFDEPGLSGAQSEFLRLVGRRPGLSVKEAAGELGSAANSVSTLVTELVRRELMVREPDPQDRRTMRLSLTDEAQRIADETRRQRIEVVAGALDQLTDAERDELRGGLRAMARLTDLLHESEQARGAKS
ncbi:MarR family winged helix-turn-helix transcriptional regulator [Nocardia sp. NBC_00511]|uniref:MarR family winged helix-turn-helix transcriptional regulator n=1 Tax=Nocardia sp. NBC_00511 TaxID=2903591 RepID=UPI0030E3156A